MASAVQCLLQWHVLTVLKCTEFYQVSEKINNFFCECNVVVQIDIFTLKMDLPLSCLFCFCTKLLQNIQVFCALKKERVNLLFRIDIMPVVSNIYSVVFNLPENRMDPRLSIM